MMKSLGKLFWAGTATLFLALGIWNLINPIERVFSPSWFFTLTLWMTAALIFTAVRIWEFLFRRRVTGTFVTVVEVVTASSALVTWAGNFGLFEVIWYSNVVHFYNSAAAAFLAWPVIVERVKGWRRPVGVIGFIFLVGLLIEVIEYYGDKFLGTHMYGQPGDPWDTQKDIFYDFLGAAIVYPLISWVAPRMGMKEKSSHS